MTRSFDVAVWGPPFWETIHNVALAYPDNPSSQDKINYKQFYLNLDKVLPCTICVKYMRDIVASYDISDYLDSPTHLFEWTVLIHNAVNKHLKKPILTLDVALAHHGRKISVSDTESLKRKEAYTFTLLLFSFFILVFLISSLISIKLTTPSNPNLTE
jgi:hypothetical protein